MQDHLVENQVEHFTVIHSRLDNLVTLLEGSDQSTSTTSTTSLPSSTNVQQQSILDRISTLEHSSSILLSRFLTETFQTQPQGAEGRDLVSGEDSIHASWGLTASSNSSSHTTDSLLARLQEQTQDLESAVPSLNLNVEKMYVQVDRMESQHENNRQLWTALDR